MEGQEIPQGQPQVATSAVFAVGDGFQMIGNDFSVTYVISFIDDKGWIQFGSSKRLIHTTRLAIALHEGRARRVDSANKELTDNG